MSIFNCNGVELDFSRPQVMGIINITPDSFYKQSRHEDFVEVHRTVAEMLVDGASIIDLGAVSSRPGANMLSLEEEQARIIPIFRELRTSFPETIFSIDTFRSEIARQAIGLGANMINDISAGNLDDKMFDVIVDAPVPYVMMHMKGDASNMQSLVNYDNMILELMAYFNHKIAKLKYRGKHDIIIDPGFGFSKTIDQNYELLKMLNIFSVYEMPMLIGVSRKSMVYRFLDITPEESLPITSVLHLESLRNGARILRVHDVKEAVHVVKVYEKLNE